MTLNTIGSQLYIDGLQTALDNAVCALDLAKAEKNNAQTTYNNAKTWKDLITEYWERIQTTNELAEDILGCIPRILEHATKVGDNTNFGNAAIKLLVNATKLVSKCADDLKAQVQDLQYKVDCLNDPNLDPNKGILKCLAELNAAITEAQNAACISIEKALDALTCSCDLTTAINGANGIKESIQALEANIKLGAKPGLEDSDLEPLGRRPKFPLTILDCDYFDYVKKEANETNPEGAAIRDCADAQDALDEKQNVKDLAQAKHDAVKAALETAMAAKRC